MSRFIDMDKLVMPKGTVDEIRKKGVPSILDWLAEQESIEIIRCKDCRHRNQYGECIQQYTEYGREKKVDDDFFCADGEGRKKLC